jgi:ParB-like chromosome segregation protein Spo0J
VFPLDAWRAVQDDQRANALYADAHPFQLALRWRQEIAADSRVTKARIAIREGRSRARVTQVMNLLQLPIQIQQQLQNPPYPLQIHLFSERRLRAILAIPDEESQMQDWQDWIQELVSSQPGG